MDDVSSGSGMGYDTFYFTSDVSRELESMSHGSARCNRPEDEDQVNIHQENSMENWITNDETNSDQKKFCVIDNHMGIGDDWLQGSVHVNERTKSSAEDEDNFSAGDEEERYNADDEDKFSTEEEIKYSAEEDDITLSTEEEAKYSADEDEAKYCVEDVKSSGEEDEVKYSTEEDETKYSADEECKISTEEEGKYSADELDDEWLGTQGHVDGQFEERAKERWVGCSEYGVGNTEQQWQSSSEEVEHSSTESEVELSEEDQEEVINKGTGDLPSTSSVSFGEATVAQPVLCFDEYGNLTTTYHSPTVNLVKMPNLSTDKMLPESKNISVSLPTNEPNKRKSGSPYCEECIEEPYNGEVKALRSRSKVGQESGENVLSDQELKQAFKEEFMTAATSRYGRARKRKTEDGFFFGTINFNELRKITSGSPKKSKGSSSKNSSPEQKMKHITKEDLKDKLNVDQVNEEVIQNGTVKYDEGEGGEIRGNISSSKVQISETKDEILVQTSSVGQSDSSDKDLSKYIRNKHDTHRDLKLKNDTASNGGFGKNANVEEQMNMNFKPTNFGTQEGNSTNVDTTESGDSIDDVSDRASIYDRRRRLSLRKRSCSVTRVTESHSIVSSDRLLRGRSDVSRIKRSLQACEQVVPHKRPKKTIPEIEPPMYVSNSVSTDSQDSQEDHGEDPESLTRPPSTRKSSQEFKAESEELASITKSGRIIRKPQLMDISNEDKRQKLSREQQRQSEALLSSSLDEEFAHSGLNMRALEQENPCKHLVGDLVWVHIRGSPLWPAMISYDPILGQFSKISLTQNWHKVRSIRMYHVQFFSDNALTYWIAPGNVLPFEGFVKLKEFLSELKCKLKGMKRYKRLQTESLLKTLVHMNKISSGQKHERWIKAIEEAKAASSMDRYERIQKYALENSEIEDKEDIHRFVKSSPRNLSLLKSKDPSFEPKPEKRKRGRPRKISLQNELPILKSLKSNGDSTDGEFSGFDENSSCEDKKKKLNIVSKLSMESDFAVYTQKHLEEFMLENPEMSAETAQNKLRWKWKKMSSSQTARYKSKFTCGDKYMLKDPEVNMLKRKHDIPFEEGDECEENEGLSAKRQRTEEEVESIRGVYKVVRNEKVCYRCESVSNKAGADMIRCKGLCCGVFHLSCLGLTAMPKRDFKCEECQTGQHPCFLCKSFVGVVQRCTVPFCGKYYHEECVQKWPQVSKQRQQERFVCPRHACHMCAANADDMGDPVARNPPFTRCLRCPTTYHTGEDCIAAGTEEVSQNHHICTKHLQLPKNGTHHVNVNWCFCCSKGGSLLLCDQCPAAFHADCMKITAPEGGYVCEDCEFGKFPIYGDIVWVKLGLYRWWPGQVLHPRFIPDNIENLQHQQGMFCVHFFGSNDYYWVTRGRAFLYQEGDKGSRAQSSKTLEMQFRRALEEAAEAYRAQKTKKTQREIRWSEKGNLKPPPYVRIDSNRPVGNIRLSKLDLAAVNRCDCDPYSENPCGSDEKCLNRMLMFECVREVCGAGDRCGNQRFQKRQYPNVCSFRTESRGWGLKTNQDVKKGEFVIEYVGELIDDEEFHRRILEMHEVKEENYYFLTIDKDIMIDAVLLADSSLPTGVGSHFVLWFRFMNHSCQPNCETQKWTVGGDTRVGLFAIEDIPAGFELTFNYNLQCVGTEKKRCCCGAPNCSGFIGVKVQKAEVSGPKREKLGKQRRKRRRREAKLSEDECFRCGGPGDLILCDVVACPKGYHLECLGLDKLPRGKWICPWHHCDECGQRSARLNRCDFCPNSFCRLHLQGNLQHLNGIGTVCQDHNSDELETVS
ncbi:histone-lysine N-methyltransferase Nsd1-like [Homarus americanus]|uniref:Histone-lysine N-methyltransferase Nsd1-like n=1 Tax=Homarus americanus TaxID=6706 RepID=A0A8J5K4V9_HOMAM|nr:histone-lysine N-methyltransferase Nsd1-like [Homarus americanus]